MANFMQIANKIMSVLPKTAGASGRIKLSKTQLELAVKEGGKEGKLLKELLSKAKEPTVEIGFKAKSNYTIAGLRVKDGKQVLGQGAISITNPGQSNAVVKMRESIGPNGSIISTNGFLDGGKPADAKDIALSIARKNGITTADVSSGKAFAGHVTVNEKAAMEVAQELGADNIIKGYVQGSNNLQNALDKFMVDARQLLRGGSNPAPVPPLKPVNTIQQVKPFTKDLKNFKIDEFGQIKRNVIPGVQPPKINQINSDTFEQVFGTTKDEMTKQLQKLAKTDRVGFEKLRKDMGTKGWQPYFDPKTGKLGIMEGKSLEDVAQKLNYTKLPSPESYTAQGRMRYSAQRRYNAVKDAEYSPEKRHAYKQEELNKAFANFEDNVPLNKREWSEILHQNVDDIIQTKFIG